MYLQDKSFKLIRIRDCVANYLHVIIHHIKYNKQILLRIEKLFKMYKSTMRFYTGYEIKICFDSYYGNLIRTNTDMKYYKIYKDDIKGYTKNCDFCGDTFHFNSPYMDKNTILQFENGKQIFSIDVNCYHHFRKTLNLVAFIDTYVFLYCVSFNSESIFIILGFDILFYMRKLIVNNI